MGINNRLVEDYVYLTAIKKELATMGITLDIISHKSYGFSYE